MPPDPHEVRMAAGQQAMDYIDLWDADSLPLVESFIEPLQVLNGHLKDRDVSTRDRASILSGMVMAIVVPLDETA
jgi:hypothetical protein